MMLSEVIKIVKCINAKDTEFLTEGKIYDVVDYYKMIDSYDIVDNGGYVDRYSCDRFEEVK